jgi:ubiquinone/menaquinone biosynthesis C-methylase UbiE
VCARLLREAGAFPLNTKSIADIGCGNGQWLLEFLQWGALSRNLHGVDLLEERIAQAKQRLAGANLHCGDARGLPWDDHTCDLVTQFTLFSSLPDDRMRVQIASEMMRVLRPNGHILWYDCRYSNPARAAVRGLNRETVKRLFPGCSIRFAGSTLIPPLARFVAQHSWAAAAALESLPFTCTHLVAVITPAR